MRLTLRVGDCRSGLRVSVQNVGLAYAVGELAGAAVVSYAWALGILSKKIASNGISEKPMNKVVFKKTFQTMDLWPWKPGSNLSVQQ